MSFINEQIGYNRFVYNFFLERAVNLYKIHNIKFNYYESKKIIPLLKKGFPFLKEANSQSLQSSLKNLSAAFKNFFEKGAGYPKFKKKGDYNSLSIPQGFRYIGNKLHIPKLKTSIKVKVSRHKKNSRVLITEKIKSVSVSKTAARKYYVNLLVEKEFYALPKTNKVSGIDLGVKNLAIIVSGDTVNNTESVKVANPKYLLRAQDKLKKLNRQFAKKTKGSKNKIKFRNRLQVIHEKVTNQRKDFLHKLSSRTVNDSQVIVLEDLNIKGMVKNRHLSKSIQDVSWSMFAGQLAYKANWYGRDIIKVNRFYPSSKTCSNCGYIKQDLKLSDREWTCPDCGITHDRDINASINLFLEGLKIGRVSPELERSGNQRSSLTPAEYAPAGMQSTAYSRHTSKQEASQFIDR